MGVIGMTIDKGVSIRCIWRILVEREQERILVMIRGRIKESDRGGRGISSKCESREVIM